MSELDPEADPPRPRFADPFPGRRDLVEVTAVDATPELVGGAIQHHGCVLVRGLLPPEATQTLIHDIDQAFDGLERASEGAQPTETSPWYVPLADHPDRPAHKPEARAFPGFFRVCAVDSPRSLYDVVRSYEAAGVHDLVRGILGTRPVLTGNKWALRRMQQRRLTFWHQEMAVFDRASTQTEAGRLRTVNVWMALSEAGDNAPGFEVLPRRETVVHPAERAYAMSDELFDAVRDRDYASPLYGPGDAMIFDEWLLHRTKSDPSMTGQRYSIESWYFSPGGLPERDAVVL